MVTDKSGLLNKWSGVASRRMSKGLRIIKSTECNLESEQTRNSLRDSQPGHKAGPTLYCLSSIRTGAPFNKRMGDLARRISGFICS